MYLQSVPVLKLQNIIVFKLRFIFKLVNDLVKPWLKLHIGQTAAGLEWSDFGRWFQTSWCPNKGRHKYEVRNRTVFCLFIFNQMTERLQPNQL